MAALLGKRELRPRFVDKQPSGPYSFGMKKYNILVLSVILAALFWLPALPAGAEEEPPDLSLVTIDGQPWKLSDHKGRVVIINFFATWCGPCRKEVPDLVELQEKHGEKGLTIIGLAYNSDPAEVSKFAQKYKINYPVAIYGKDQVQAYGGVSAVPTTFLVDRKGKVAAGSEGLIPKAVLEEKILELLKPNDA